MARARSVVQFRLCFEYQNAFAGFGNRVCGGHAEKAGTDDNNIEFPPAHGSSLAV